MNLLESSFKKIDTVSIGCLFSYNEGSLDTYIAERTFGNMLFSRDLEKPEFKNIDKEFYKKIFLTKDEYGNNLLSAMEIECEYQGYIDESTEFFYIGFTMFSDITTDELMQLKDYIFKPFAEKYEELHSINFKLKSVLCEKKYIQIENITLEEDL